MERGALLYDFMTHTPTFLACPPLIPPALSHVLSELFCTEAFVGGIKAAIAVSILPSPQQTVRFFSGLSDSASAFDNWPIQIVEIEEIANVVSSR